MDWGEWGTPLTSRINLSEWRARLGDRLNRLDRRDRGAVLIGAGVVLLVVTLVASAAAAPDRDVVADAEPAVLVGSQGGGFDWRGLGAVYELRDGGEAWRIQDAGSYFEVHRLDDGRVLAAFRDGGYQDCGQYDPPCSNTGFRIVDPDADGGPAIDTEYAFPISQARSRQVHAVDVLSSGEFVIADMDRERVFTVDDGEITWEWFASSFYEAPDDPTKHDWLHINDVDAINDTHFLVSVRNANQVLVLERDAGVVEVINEDHGPDGRSCMRALVDADGDGDVRCGDPGVLHHQHNPQWLDEGAILVADSENDRIVELHRDDATGEWEPAWTLEEAGGLELRWPRDADRLANGNTLVTDTRNKRILEVAPNGTLVWSRATENYPYEADHLPDGELVGAQRYDGGRDSDTGGDVPGLSLGVVVLHAAVPAIPVWFKEVQLGLTLLAVGLAGAGTIFRWRA